MLFNKVIWIDSLTNYFTSKEWEHEFSYERLIADVKFVDEPGGGSAFKIFLLGITVAEQFQKSGCNHIFLDEADGIIYGFFADDEDDVLEMFKVACEKAFVEKKGVAAVEEKETAGEVLAKMVHQLTDENAALKAEVEELRRRIQNSQRDWTKDFVIR